MQGLKPARLYLHQNMISTVYKRFDITVAQPNTSVSQTFELEKSILTIKGLLLTSDRDDLLYANGSARIEINGEEIFPELYESKLLMSGINVPPNKRYHELNNLQPGNGRVKIEYTDGVPGSGAALPAIEVQPYRVSLYLHCEMEE